MPKPCGRFINFCKSEKKTKMEETDPRMEAVLPMMEWNNTIAVIADGIDLNTWHSTRGKYFGASDASRVLAKDGTATIETLIAEKALGKFTEFENESTRRGHRLEEKVIEKLQAMGLHVIPLQLCFRNAKLPQWCCTLDAAVRVSNEQAADTSGWFPLEIKTSSICEPWKTLPIAYYRQCQIQMAIMEVRKMYLWCAFGCDDADSDVLEGQLVLYEVTADDKVTFDLESRGKEIYQRIVELRRQENEREFF